MADPAVELDDQAERVVLHVAVHPARHGPVGQLTTRRRQPVPTLHLAQIGMLEDGGRPGGDVVERRAQPSPVTQSLASVEGGEQPGRRSAPALTRLGRHRERIAVAPAVGTDVEHGLLDDQPRRAEVPPHPGRQVRQPVQPHPVELHGAARMRDRDVHELGGIGRPVRPGHHERGLVAQRRRPVEQHHGPGPLVPRRRAGVIQVHPLEQGHPLTPADLPFDEVVVSAGRDHLTSRDHAALLFEQRDHHPLIHRDIVRPRQRLGGGLRRRVWIVPCGRPLWTGSGGCGPPYRSDRRRVVPGIRPATTGRPPEAS